MQQWEVTVGECCTEGAEGQPTYGIRVVCRDGLVWQWPDVDVNRAVVADLVSRLQTLQPEPCHFADLVLDYIQEVAGEAP